MALVDSSGASYAVPLVSVASGQVNYMVPPGVQTGPAWLTITSGDGTVSQGVVLVAPVAPGIYTANANGQGVAAAMVVTQHADGSQAIAPAYNCATGECQPQPISLGQAGGYRLSGTVRHGVAACVVVIGRDGAGRESVVAGGVCGTAGPVSRAGSGERAVAREPGGERVVNVVVTTQDTGAASDALTVAIQ